MADKVNYRERAEKLFRERMELANKYGYDNEVNPTKVVKTTTTKAEKPVKVEPKKEEPKPTKVVKTRKAFKDVSKSTDLKEIVNAIRKLNPKVIIKREDDTIYSSVPAEELVLPKGFNYTKETGITNKDKTISIKVLDLALINEKEFRDKKKNEVKAKKVVKARKAKKSTKALYPILIIVGLGLTGFGVYKSGIIQNAWKNHTDKRYLEQQSFINAVKKTQEEQAKAEAEGNTTVKVTIDENNSVSVDEEILPTVQEPEVEYISDELLQSGYNFRNDITPETLKNLNPSLSNNALWIEIPGTKINNLVVLPSVDNLESVPGLIDEIENSEYYKWEYMNHYYLNHDTRNNKTDWGTIYQDIYTKPLNQHTSQISDMNVLYGHHMQDGSMFTGLDKWKKDAEGKYNAEHPYGVIYTDDGLCYKLTFITSKVITADDPNNLFVGDFNSVEEKQAYINHTIYQAKYSGNFTVDEYVVDENTKFMSLVTCSYAHPNDRFVLIGVLEKQAIRDINLNGYEIKKEKER